MFAGSSSLDRRGIASIINRTITFKKRYSKREYGQPTTTVPEHSITIGQTNCMIVYEDGKKEVEPLLSVVRKYPHTLTGFMEQLGNVSFMALSRKQRIVHNWPVGTFLFLENTRYPNDRVVMITAHIQDEAYDWMKEYTPIYKVKHIDHKDKELATNNIKISTQLSNGIRIHNGGEGAVALSDVSLIAQGTGDPKYDYLRIQLFIKDQCLLSMKLHCRELGESLWEAVVKGMQKMLFKTAGSEAGIWQTVGVFVAKEYIDKELLGKLRSIIDEFEDWKYDNKSKTSKSCTIDYDTLYDILGDGIVRNYRLPNEAPFTVQCTKLIITVHPKSTALKNTKLKGLIKKVYM
eukprot:172400_1